MDDKKMGDKKSTRTKMLEEAKIEDDPLYIKRAIRGAGVGVSKLADKLGYTQEEEYKKMEEKNKKRAGGMTKMKKGGAINMSCGGMHKKKMKSGGAARADGCCMRGKTKGRIC